MIVAFGEVMARIAPPERRRWRQALPGLVEVTWGGGEANVSAALALWGTPVRYVTALPRNPLAESLVASLRGLGVDTDSILWRAGRLGLYFVEIGANQRASTVLYDRDHSAVSLASVNEYDFDRALNDVHWLHVTGITPAISETAFQVNLEIVRRAKSAGAVVSCDLNFRKKLWRWRQGCSAQQLARECMAQVLPYTDVVIANEEDAADVLDIHAQGTDVAQGRIDAAAYVDVARQIVSRFSNVRYVAVTLRESISADHNNWGGMLYDAASESACFAPIDERGFYRPYEIRNIVDRIGGGDSFAAGIIFGLDPSRHGSPQDAIHLATAASCLKHSIHGDFAYITISEIEALAAGNTSGRVQR
jgi:2-dehydro-3-deoxygluconokinase